MVQKIKIKRSDTTSAPSSLEEGELAYSSASGSNKLYIGNPGSGSPASVTVIGGKAYVDLLDHTPGTLTASSAVLVDASGKIDVFDVDNVNINGNTVSSSDTNGNLNLTPNGAGNLVLDGVNWPQADGGTGQVLSTNGAGQTSWITPASQSFNISDGTTSPEDEFTLGNTLSFLGTANEIVTTISNDTITFALPDDVTIGNDLTVTGDLVVNGTTTTVNSTTVSIDDPIFTLGSVSPVVDDNKDRGIEFNWNNGSAVVGFFGHDDSTGKFIYIPDATNTSEVFSGTTGVIQADFEVVNTFTFDSVGLTAVTTSAEAFADNDTSLMTSAAIDDRILSYGYGVGDITSVQITSTDSSISGTGTGSTGAISFDLQVATVDGGTF